MLRERKTLPGVKHQEVREYETRHRQTALKIAREGVVLLENKKSGEKPVLPLKKGTRIGLYGSGARKTIKGGSGSGDVNERSCVTIEQGLEHAGFVIEKKEWLDRYDQVKDASIESWKNGILARVNEAHPFTEIYFTTPYHGPEENKITENEMPEDAEAVLYVISRISGEGADRGNEPGDFLFSESEKENLKKLDETGKDLIVILNTGGLMDLAFADEFTNIRAIVQYVQAGQEGGNAFADVFTGEVTPSGKMTDTWAKTYNDYPGAEVFSYKSGNLMKEYYEEGIFVGYRYFDTFQIPVRYGFGYGLSYTDFAITAGTVSVSDLGTMDPKVSVEVNVKNSGDTYAGKEVVQIYASCPQGELVKEFRRLAGFGKTKLLAPGEEQQMRITFPLYQLASYSEDQAAWILEPGKYGIWVGNELNTSVLSGALELDQEAVMVQCENICPLKEELNEIMPFARKVQARELAWHEELKAKGFITISGRVNRQYFYERLYGTGNPQGDTTMSYKAGQE